MKLIDLKNSFTSLFEKIIKIEDSNSKERIKDTKINNEISKTFKVIKKNVNIDFENLSDNTVKSLYNTLKKYKNLRRKGQHSMGGRVLSKKEIKIQKAERKALIEARMKGKNTTERLTRNENKLKRDVKKIRKKKEKEKPLKQRFGQEYRKTKNTIKNDSHRIKEKIKDYIYQKIEKQFNLEKVWNCTFKNSRDAHKEMHQQIADKDGFFYAPTGEKTKYPGGFGIAKLDINCHCYVEIRRKKEE